MISGVFSGFFFSTCTKDGVVIPTRVSSVDLFPSWEVSGLAYGYGAGSSPVIRESPLGDLS